MNQPENFTLKATLESESSRQPEEKKSAVAEFFAWLGRALILLALVVAPWMYGGVQSRAQYWLAVAALLGLALWWFETALNKRRKQVFPYVIFLVLGGVLIGLLQLLPANGLMEIARGRQVELYAKYSVDGDKLPETETFSGLNEADSGEVFEDSSEAAEEADDFDAEAVSDAALGIETNTPRHYLSMDREATWGQLRLLAIACAGLLLGCRLFRRREDMMWLAGTLALNGACISFFGFIQRMTAPPRTVYWLELSQGGQPFGPFVNRNNAAGFLLLCFAAALAWLILTLGDRKNKGPVPMISKEMPPWRQFYFQFLYLISEMTALKVASLIATALIGCGILATLSRGGVLAFGSAGIVTLLVYGMARRPKNTGMILIPLVGLVVGLAVWMGFADQLISRFEHTELDVEELVDTEKRLQNWRDTFPAVSEMGWLGSGLGTYGKVHRLYRQDHEEKIFEFAENQYFQSLVEAGWGGCILFVLAWVVCWAYSSFLIYRGQSNASIAVGTAGIFLVVSQAIAAMVDFGLYLAANMLTLSVLVGFVAYHAHGLASRLKKWSWLQYQFPNRIVQVMLLLVFAGVTLAVFDLSRHSSIERLASQDVWRLGYDEMGLEETDRRIQELSSLASVTVSAESLNQLGELWLHRCRLEMWNDMESLPAFEQIPAGESGETLRRRFWALTRLSKMYENFAKLKNESELSAARFIERKYIPYNLGNAYQHFALSRALSPLQPQVHLQLGRINSVFNRISAAKADLRRAIELAPGNADIRVAAGMLWLQQGQTDLACEQLKQSLVLRPQDFERTMNTVFGLTRRFVTPLTPGTVFRKVIPADPKMMYRLATEYVEGDPSLQLEILEEADSILGEISKAKRQDLLLSANIKLKLGLIDESMELLNDVLISYPSDDKVRLKLARLCLQENRLGEAADHVEKLLRSDRKNKSLLSMQAQIEQLKKQAK